MGSGRFQVAALVVMALVNGFDRPVAASTEAGPAARSARVLSKTYLVDRKFKSMTGPQSTQPVFLLESATPELLWVTGFSAVVVGSDGETPASQEFMCHSNLDLNMSLHKRLFGLKRDAPNRIFTLSQGQQEIHFPPGFGLPVMSDEPFRLTTQVLNHNIEGQSFEVRHKVTIDFVHDADLRSPLKPLFQMAATGMVLIDGKDPYYGIPEPDTEAHGPGCLVGQNAQETGFIFLDPQGRRFTGHWLVKPGRQVNHSNITRYMNLPFDTTAHYIAIHLHPFAESLELRDLTAGKTVYLSKVRPSEGRIGIDHVDHFTSVEGIQLFKDHEYELVSVYNNTSQEDQDSMAVMYIYVLDKEYVKPPM